MTSDELAPLYATYASAWREVARRSGAGNEAEDAVHDACVAALAGALPLPRETDEMMVRRLVTTYASTYRRQGDRVDRYHDVIRRGQLPPHDMLGRIEQRIAVQRAVDSLEGSLQMTPAWIWGAVQGLTYLELAGLAQRKSAQNMHRRLLRAWVALRELLGAWREGRRHRGPEAEICGESSCQR